MYFDFLGQAEFWTGFWSNLCADLVAGIFLAFLLSKVTNIFKKPNLKMVVKQDGFYRNTILLDEAEDGNYKATFVLAVKNDGSQAIKPGEGYWHAYLKANNIFTAVGEWNHQRAPIELPVFPDTIVDLSGEFQFTVTREDLTRASIPYFFSTTYGRFPRSTRMELETGYVGFASIGSLQFELRNP